MNACITHNRVTLSQKYGVATVRFRENGRWWGWKSNQSLLLSLPPTHYPNSSQSQKILLVLDVLGLLHQEALALKKGIGILGLGRLNRHVVESGKK